MREASDLPLSHRRVNNQACACGWTAKKAGHRGWSDRCTALDRHIKENSVSATASTKTCDICGAGWSAPVSDCPVCTDPAVIEAVEILTRYGVDGPKYERLLREDRLNK